MSGQAIQQGMRFGALVTVSRTSRVLSSGRKMPAWVLVCDCGAEVVAMNTNLAKGKHKSCGCESKARMKVSRGDKNVTSRPFYRVYRQMLDRCYLPTAPNFKWYGGRGISVCDRWRFGANGMSGFECFDADMSPRPEGMTLDRRNNGAGYAPENCRWATVKDQQRNRRDNRNIEVLGVVRTVAEWSELMGVSPSAITTRIRRGWPPDLAATTPTLAQWSRHGINQPLCIYVPGAGA